MEENKSVIQHLEDIEQNIEQSSQGKTISQMIGENFDEYMDRSEVYYYEPDERKFNKIKKKQSKKYFIISIIYLLPLIFHIAISAIYSYVIFWNYIIDILFVLCPVFRYIYVKKQKRKKLANSRWNIKNHVFYRYENQLTAEDSKGVFGKALLAYSIISTILFAGSILFIHLGSYNASFKDITIWTQYGLFLICCVFHITDLWLDYDYPEYIFETNDSYVIMHEWNNWEKRQK